jgi:YD repeat-containing protein
MRLRRAIGYWNQVSLPVSLVLAQSPRSADVTVDIIRSFPPDNRLTGNEYRAGLTSLTYDEAGRITRARVFVAEATPFGTRYALIDQEGTLLHELGHALGLPHVANPFALMSSRPRVTSLTGFDVGLARSVYQGAGCPRAQLAAGRPYDR